ncbi:MAG: polysaccharide biosynthesis protein [Gemmatimonadaceae bacterium]|nr:polysaccharide biosynthesis protein [Gemmatimonadaceae bacterium]
MSTTRTRVLGSADLIVSLAATLLAALARFERWPLPAPYDELLPKYAFAVCVIRFVIFYATGAYSQAWRYASVREAVLLFYTGVFTTALTVIGGRAVAAFTGTPVPWSVLLLDSLIFMGGAVCIRLVARARRQRAFGRARPAREGRMTLIVGAGSAGQLVAREMIKSDRTGMVAFGFLDDDYSLHGKRILGLPVLGHTSDMVEIAKAAKLDLVVIATPSAPGSFIRRIVHLAREAGVEARTVPGLDDLLSGRVSIAALRQVQIGDLLRRESVEVDLQGLQSMAAGRTILITGAGGSIGSELCRQIATLDPGHIILLGHGENSIFEIHAELRERFPDVRTVPIIADVKDAERIHRVFQDWRPFAVFHAAAHKHVPLMEDNVIEAVLNNVVGTRNVVTSALDSGVQHFVLISTDKAVRPANIMGATKRVAEMIVSHAAHTHQVHFMAVRFGNVLGSRGSVVPTFMRQIRNGGPITLTHPEMRRFFMTIPEATRLVLQAGAIGTGGEVFCLDMGEPVRIYDLALDLIRLSGLTEGEDIEIVFNGVRPGEKLYEELFFSGDEVLKTTHPKIMKARYQAPDLRVYMQIVQLIESAMRNASDSYLRRSLEEIVPDFDSPGRAVRAAPAGEAMERPTLAMGAARG